MDREAWQAAAVHGVANSRDTTDRGELKEARVKDSDAVPCPGRSQRPSWTMSSLNDGKCIMNSGAEDR